MTKQGEVDPLDRLDQAVKRQDMEERGAKALTEARCRLVLGKNAQTVFFAALALKLIPKVSWDVDTAATDGKLLYYNPEWFLALAPDQRLGVTVHEVMHLALTHHARRGHRDLERYQLAADLSINPLIRDAGFTLPDAGVYPGQGKYKDLPMGLSMEEYYELLGDPKQKQDPEDEGQGGGGGGGAAAGQGDGDGKGDSQGEGDSPGQGSCPDPGGCGGVMAPGDGSPAAERESEAEWEVALAQAHQAAKQRGALPACIDRLVADLLAPKVDWREVLRQFVSQVARNDYAWHPCNRRFVWQGIYLPGLRSDELGELVVAVDTSGSIGEEEIQTFGSEIQGILEAFADVSLTILYCDARIQHVQTWRSSDGPLKMEPKGGGGTSHRPVFEWINEQAELPTCLVCLTDMYTQFPDVPPDYPVLWASTTKGMAGPFGQTVEVTL